MINAQEGFNKLVATCGSAATILDGMITTWGDILDNLIRLKSAVTGDPHVGAGAMLEVINQDEVKQKWNTLATRSECFKKFVARRGLTRRSLVDNFLTVTRAMDPDQQTV